MELPTSNINEFKQSKEPADTIHGNRLRAAAKNKTLRQACADFESVLLNKMISTMRESIPKDGLFEQSFGEEMFQAMHDEEISKSMSGGQGTGLGELLYRQLTQQNS